MAKNVVITGSARGLGLALAQECYRRGCCVAISDIEPGNTAEAAASFKAPLQVIGIPCDVTDPSQVQNLWEGALTHFGHIDIWINNAGRGGNQRTVADSEPDFLAAVIDTNIRGVVLGTRTAVRGMTGQGSGAIYNIAGFGVDGRMGHRMTIYGTTKRAVGYFSQSMSKEIEGSGVTLGWINPGMVVTPMVIEGFRDMPEELRGPGLRIWNLAGETPEKTARDVADAIEADSSNGTFIKLLTTRRLLGRFLVDFIRKRDVMSQHGIS